MPDLHNYIQLNRAIGLTPEVLTGLAFAILVMTATVAVIKCAYRPKPPPKPKKRRRRAAPLIPLRPEQRNEHRQIQTVALGMRNICGARGDAQAASTWLREWTDSRHFVADRSPGEKWDGYEGDLLNMWDYAAINSQNALTDFIRDHQASLRQSQALNSLLSLQKMLHLGIPIAALRPDLAGFLEEPNIHAIDWEGGGGEQPPPQTEPEGGDDDTFTPPDSFIQ